MLFTPQEAKILKKAKAILDSKIRTGDALHSSAKTRDFLRLHMSAFEREVFTVLFLDNQNRVIATEDLFFGTIDGATVHVREVAKAALQHNAAALIFAHNHPSGVAEPSQADIGITRRLKNALGLLEIRTLDHFVVGNPEIVSLAERGLL